MFSICFIMEMFSGFSIFSFPNFKRNRSYKKTDIKQKVFSSCSLDVTIISPNTLLTVTGKDYFNAKRKNSVSFT